MEQDITNTVPEIKNEKTNDKKEWKIATATASIIALCSIGFGVYGMIQNSQKDSQIKQKDDKISELETVIKNNGSTNNNNQTNSSSEEYKKYLVGDKISFKGEDWHVIADSSSSDDYVTVLKDQVILEYADERKSYYKCPEEDDNGLDCSNKMSNDYNKSAPKQYLNDIYIDKIGKENLKEVNGYYIRLITIEELESLGCDIETLRCENSPSWLANPDSWTMSPTTETPTDDASKASVYAFGGMYDTNWISKSGVGSTLHIRPVINILKNKIENQ